MVAVICYLLVVDFNSWDDFCLLRFSFPSQESEDFEEISNSRNNKKTEYGQETDSPISSPTSFSGGSCNSMDSKISYTSNGTGSLTLFFICLLISNIAGMPVDTKFIKVE